MTTTTTRTLIEKRKRGFFGWLFLLVFWGWNALMVWALMVGAQGVSEHMKTVDPQYHDAAMAGAGIGYVINFFIWAVGSVVFGALAYFTRGKKIIVETISGPAA